MQGVTILNQYEATIDLLWGWNWYGIVFFCLSACCIGASFILMRNVYVDWPHEICMVLCVAFLGAGLAVQQDTVPVHETRFEALIDSTCSITEFFDRYEVIEKQDDIYILREIKYNT